ncbi:hypothetical protein [Luteibacter sp. dw_328]|uniref:hypothetical protein n=1 Tax=Luteibacter sp. dw_328 TaxID=2719796 RepID=UPI001BD309A4|nr:hypothetical protein [Luteibacter sp. dw_328]
MKLIVLGGGDLARRVIALLPVVPALREILLVTRDVERGEPLARLFGGCLPAVVRHVGLDLSDAHGVVALLRRERPDIVFHAASVLSPWLLPAIDSGLSHALRSAGFGLMLPAQLPLIRNVMRAVRDLGLTCPVVNASYPDATHAVLAAEGLQPTIGVGNAGMLHDTLRGELRARRITATIRLFAHHAQVTPFARHEGYTPGESPWLFLDDQTAPIDSFVTGPLPQGSMLNALTAAHAVAIVGALIGDGKVMHTSAPGPLGLPGGWPVSVSSDGVSLDLPPHVDIDAGLAYQTRAAIGDGIASIDADGTVHYTSAAQASLAPHAPRLAESLFSSDEAPRLAELIERLAA